jgi:YT521-B-like domain
MASEIYPQKADGVDGTGPSAPPQPPPVVLAGPKTTITPRTDKAPKGKIFEDEVRGTVFWEIADSSDDDEADEPEGDRAKSGERWGNPFRIEWVKWYLISVRIFSNIEGMPPFPFSARDCFATPGTEIKKSKFLVTVQNLNHPSAQDFYGSSISILPQLPKAPQAPLPEFDG